MSGLIDKKEFIEWLDNWFSVNRYYHPHSKLRNIPYGEVLDILERMPTIHAPRWVRCEEPPKTTEDLWLHDEHGHYHVGCVSTYHGFTEFIDMDGNTLHGIDYWMPIEPPKEV